MRRQKANTFVAFTDYLLALNNVVFILFVFAVMAMATKNTEGGIRPKAEYLIQAEWDLDHDCDVDTWVRDPMGNIIYFNHREAGSLFLDHDSRGSATDFQTLPDGTISKPEMFGEIVTLRSIVPGEYTVNVHLYGVGTSHKRGEPYTVPVHVHIIKINPSASKVFDKTVTLERIWQEITVTRFTLDAGGNWVGADPTPMQLVKDQ